VNGVAQRPKKKGPAANNETMNKRLDDIEGSLSELEEQVQEAKELMSKIETMLTEMHQSRSTSQRTRRTRARTRNTAPPEQEAQRQQDSRRHVSLFPFLGRRRESRNQNSSSVRKSTESKGLDITGLANMLQNPAVQSLIKKGLNSGVATKTERAQTGRQGQKVTKKDGLSDMLGGMDFAQVAKLLQNPMVQSMLKNMF
jgi:hypothetical protein